VLTWEPAQAKAWEQVQFLASELAQLKAWEQVQFLAS
jgi:hypothetical protein